MEEWIMIIGLIGLAAILLGRKAYLIIITDGASLYSLADWFKGPTNNEDHMTAQNGGDRGPQDGTASAETTTSTSIIDDIINTK